MGIVAEENESKGNDPVWSVLCGRCYLVEAVERVPVRQTEGARRAPHDVLANGEGEGAGTAWRASPRHPRHIVVFLVVEELAVIEAVDGDALKGLA